MAGQQKAKRQFVGRGKGVLLLALPGLLWYLIFRYLPLAGIGLAFTDFGFTANPKFIGLDNFVRLFKTSYFWRSLRNTLVISLLNLLFYFPVPVILALAVNEVKKLRIKRMIQFIIYIPNFLSWAVVASLLVVILSPSSGIVNEIIKFFGGDPIYFMASTKWFRTVLVGSNIWKSAGYGSVIFLSTLASINPELYEAAEVDGAGHIRKLWHITLPSLRSTIATVLLLNISTTLRVFEQIFVMQSAVVYSVSDVLQTLSYREGLMNGDIGFATALGLFISIVSGFLVFGTDKLSKLLFGESIL